MADQASPGCRRQLSTPRQRENTASEPSQRLRLLKTQKLHPRVARSRVFFYFLYVIGQAALNPSVTLPRDSAHFYGPLVV